MDYQILCYEEARFLDNVRRYSEPLHPKRKKMHEDQHKSTLILEHIIAKDSTNLAPPHNLAVQSMTSPALAPSS